MTQIDDYYRVLGVAQDASTLEIRRAYRRLARQHHPDRNPKPDGPERFRTLAEAYAVLNDPARRTHYDHTTQPRPPSEPPRAAPAGLTRHGLLELSPHEARLAATMPLTITAKNGATIVLPAGLADGDRITIAVPDGRAVLTVRVNFARRT